MLYKFQQKAVEGALSVSRWRTAHSELFNLSASIDELLGMTMEDCHTITKEIPYPDPGAIGFCYLIGQEYMRAEDRYLDENLKEGMEVYIMQDMEASKMTDEYGTEMFVLTGKYIISKEG